METVEKPTRARMDMKDSSLINPTWIGTATKMKTMTTNIELGNRSLLPTHSQGFIVTSNWSELMFTPPDPNRIDLRRNRTMYISLADFLFP